MSDETTPQDDAAMSPASTGSVAGGQELRVTGWRGVPVDLWIDADGDLAVMNSELQGSIVIHRKAIPEIAAWLGGITRTGAGRVVRLPPLDPSGAPGWNAAIGAVREALADAGVDWDTE